VGSILTAGYNYLVALKFIVHVHFMTSHYLQESKPMHVFPGERFDLHLHVQDQNSNPVFGVYTYPSNTHFTKADVTEIDLTTDSETDISFAIVGNDTQRTTFVIRNSSSNFNYTHCLYRKNDTVERKQFSVHLIDSSTGSVVCNYNFCYNLE